MKASYSLDRERLVMKKTDWPIRWDLLLRYRLIETIALWEGRLTTNHICHSFRHRSPAGVQGHQHLSARTGAG